ncbi:MAG: GNAT family N-acetyltransferase [Elusimicrobiales bacterium]|nr:GNAT family N-acetyltransferase [Elusimicrobiales bacterium]
MEQKKFPELIGAPRLELRKHVLDLAETMYRYVDQDRQRLRVFLPWVDTTRSVDDEAAYIRMTHASWEKGTLFDYGLFERETGTYMGNIGVHNIAWAHDRCEFGYWILSSFEGKGFISEAVGALEKVCFGLGFHRLEIRCSSRNPRSAAVPRRLGYSLDGTLKEDAIEQGSYRNTLVFAKLNPGHTAAIQ